MSLITLFGDFKVQIVEKPGFSINRIFLYNHTSTGSGFITHKGTQVFVDSGDSVPEDDLYFAEMTNDQLQAFADSLADRGIKTNKDSVAEGKLSATERHLEDMRTIALRKYK